MSAEQNPEYNPEAKAAFMMALEDQLGSPETPEVKGELDRLVKEGVKIKKAKEMMAAILAFHIVRLMKGTRDFDYSQYLAELRRLPKIDFDQSL